LRSPLLTKRLSADDDDDDISRIRLKSVTKKAKVNKTSKFGIFIQCNSPVNCNILSINETISSTPMEKPDSDILLESALMKTGKIQTKQDQIALTNHKYVKSFF
jgi:hypothetical protein